MLCANPFMKGAVACGCGQCQPCRINKRRMWVNRLMLERTQHVDASFVTLTYRDEELEDITGPAWSGKRPLIATLLPDDLQKWFKRFRKAAAQSALPSVRYFAVGEYGGDTERPHYHIALFGFPHCLHGRTQSSLRSCCAPCDMVRDTWGKGRVQLVELNRELMQYIAGYVTKKWTKEDEWTRDKLKGRHPEFARMSNRPHGIGAGAIKMFVSGTVPSRKGIYLRRSIDAPAVLRNGKSILPLGRYLRRKWREALGRGPDTPESVTADVVRQEMQARDLLIASGALDPRGLSRRAVARQAYLIRNGQKIKQAEARAKIFEQRRSL